MHAAHAPAVFLLIAALLSACSSSDGASDGGDGAGGGPCPAGELGKACTAGTGACERQGKTVCDEAAGAVACDAVAGEPQGEICDGQDNDCNGTVDDDWPSVGSSCEAGTGACRQTGYIVCSADGRSTACSAKALPSSDELCDGIDNNCDGKVDEAFPGLGKACTAGAGECVRTGAFICAPGHAGVVCDAIAGDPQPELCDGRDNNCDGAVDEAFPGLEKPCTVGRGACENTGVGVCGDDQKSVKCSVEPKPIQAEVCDGVDNNCNGFVDEGAPDCAVVVAGNGRAPLLTGEGLSETYLPWPAGIAYHAAKNELYAADLYANVILRLVWSDVDRIWLSSVLAGSGHRGITDGAAAKASFSGPAALAVDDDGLWVADSLNHAIRRVALDTGDTVRIAGTGKKGAGNGDGSIAAFNAPQAIAVAPDGSLRVADTGNHCIRAITFDPSTGAAAVTTFAGLCGTAGSVNAPARGDARFNAPRGVAVAADGRVFVADAGNQKIRLIDAAGAVTDYAAIAQSSLGALAVDEFGYLFAVDGHGTLRQIAPTRAVTTIISGLRDPAGVAIGKASSAYVAEQAAGGLRRVSLSTGTSALAAGIDVSPPGTGEPADPLVSPSGLAVDEPADLVYFSDTVAHRVKLLKAWKVTVAGGDGTAGAGDEGLDLPGRMTLVGGDVIVADARAHCLRRLYYDTATHAWNAAVVAGRCGTAGNADGDAVDARFNAPAAVTAGPGGALLVADAGNHCVRKVTLDQAGGAATVAAFAGQCGTAGLKNGPGAGALFRAPEGLAYDAASGFCFVADTGNHVVRQVASGGTVTPFSGINALPSGGGEGGYVDGAASASSFNEPAALSLAAGGTFALYVADRQNHVVRALGVDGSSTTFIGKGACGHASGKKGETELCLPTDVTVTPHGTVYIGDAGNNRIIAVY